MSSTIFRCGQNVIAVGGLSIDVLIADQLEVLSNQAVVNPHTMTWDRL
jgi:hypothetical protein